MRSLVIVSVVLGVALGQVFPRDTPEVEAARNAFIAEYNRLARLAEQAPDIHIYHRDPEQDLSAPSGVVRHRPINPPAFNAFSFSANLGANQQFVPGPNTFPGASHMPGHLAGHHVHAAPTHAPAAPTHAPAAPTHAPVSFRASQRPRITQAPLFNIVDEPVARWTGPFADEVPAGLSGHVMETPSVAAAKAAHFQAHADFWNQATRNNPTQG
ncbi:uncharacterized protein LOC127002414 [Eriocheir sinensis]|uniref:uncharacterized protein LOC127002414 n=1 Tax=Eriocheir sinensis TaxID=95602 RepID=UPI0021C848C9|nr:uncharacterized protein LOC127002414 [Eriocheir sinensis]